MIKWLIVLTMFGLPFLLRRRHYGPLEPRIILSWLWGSILVVTLLSRFADAVSLRCFWIVLLFIVAFSGGAALQSCFSLKGSDEGVIANPIPRFCFLPACVLVCFLIGLCASLAILFQHREIIMTQHMAEAWKQILSAEMTRTYDGIKRPFYFSLMITGIYGGSLLGGLLFAQQSGYARVLALLPVGAAFCYSCLTTAKAGSIQALLFWSSAFFTARLAERGNGCRLLSRPNIVAVATVCAFTALIFMIFQSFRYGYGLSEFRKSLDGLYSYPLAVLPPLCSWIHNNDLWSLRMDLGKWTFAGLFDLLGLAKREVGIFSDSVIIHGYKSNVYSVIRGLIMDFTLPGSVLIALLSGGLSNFVYHNVLRRKKWAIGILPLIYSFILWSPVVSIFSYNAITISFLIFFLYVLTSSDAKARQNQQ